MPAGRELLQSGAMAGAAAQAGSNGGGSSANAQAAAQAQSGLDGNNANAAADAIANSGVSLMHRRWSHAPCPDQCIMQILLMPISMRNSSGWHGSTEKVRIAKQ